MNFSFTIKVFIAILSMVVLILLGVIFFFDLKTTAIAEKEADRRLRQNGIGLSQFSGSDPGEAAGHQCLCERQQHFFAPIWWRPSSPRTRPR